MKSSFIRLFSLLSAFNLSGAAAQAQFIDSLGLRPAERGLSFDRQLGPIDAPLHPTKIPIRSLDKYIEALRGESIVWDFCKAFICDTSQLDPASPQLEHISRLYSDYVALRQLSPRLVYAWQKEKGAMHKASVFEDVLRFDIWARSATSSVREDASKLARLSVDSCLIRKLQLYGTSDLATPCPGVSDDRAYTPSKNMSFPKLSKLNQYLQCLSERGKEKRMWLQNWHRLAYSVQLVFPNIVPNEYKEGFRFEKMPPSEFYDLHEKKFGRKEPERPDSCDFVSLPPWRVDASTTPAVPDGEKVEKPADASIGSCSTSEICNKRYDPDEGRASEFQLDRRRPRDVWSAQSGLWQGALSAMARQTAIAYDGLVESLNHNLQVLNEGRAIAAVQKLVLVQTTLLVELHIVANRLDLSHTRKAQISTRERGARLKAHVDKARGLLSQLEKEVESQLSLIDGIDAEIDRIDDGILTLERAEGSAANDSQENRKASYERVIAINRARATRNRQVAQRALLRQTLSRQRQERAIAGKDISQGRQSLFAIARNAVLQQSLIKKLVSKNADLEARRSRTKSVRADLASAAAFVDRYQGLAEADLFKAHQSACWSRSK